MKMEGDGRKADMTGSLWLARVGICVSPKAVVGLGIWNACVF